MPPSVELRQRRASLWEEAKSLHTLAEKEGRQMTAEERQQWDRINTEIDSLKIPMDRLERISEIDDEMNDIDQPIMARAQPEIQHIESYGAELNSEYESAIPASTEYRRAFGAYLQLGLGALSSQ